MVERKGKGKGKGDTKGGASTAGKGMSEDRRQCYNCWEYGNIGKDCPLPDRRKQGMRSIEDAPSLTLGPPGSDARTNAGSARSIVSQRPGTRQPFMKLSMLRCKGCEDERCAANSPSGPQVPWTQVSGRWKRASPPAPECEAPLPPSAPAPRQARSTGPVAPAELTKSSFKELTEINDDKYDEDECIDQSPDPVPSKIKLTKRQRVRRRAIAAKQMKSKGKMDKDHYKNCFDCVLVDLQFTPPAESAAQYARSRRARSLTVDANMINGDARNESPVVNSMSPKELQWMLDKHCSMDTADVEKPRLEDINMCAALVPLVDCPVELEDMGESHALSRVVNEDHEESDASSWNSDNYCERADPTSSSDNDSAKTLGSIPTKAGSRSETAVETTTYTKLGAHLSTPEANVNIQFDDKAFGPSVRQSLVDAAHAVTKHVGKSQPPPPPSKYGILPAYYQPSVAQAMTEGLPRWAKRGKFRKWDVGRDGELGFVRGHKSCQCNDRDMCGGSSPPPRQVVQRDTELSTGMKYGLPILCPLGGLVTKPPSLFHPQWTDDVGKAHADS